MSNKEAIQHLEAILLRKVKITKIIPERQDLFSKIGEGKIKPGNSRQQTLKVANAKAAVEESIKRLENTAAELDEEIAKNATLYPILIEQISQQLEELKAYVGREYDGQKYLESEIIESHQREYQILTALGKEIQVLAQAMAAASTEEERTATERLPKTFQLENTNKIFSRNMAKILYLISHGTEQNPTKREEIAKKVWPKTPYKTSGNRLSAALAQLKIEVKEHGYEIISVPLEEDARKKGYYLLNKTPEKNSQQKQVQPGQQEQLDRETLEINEYGNLSGADIAAIAMVLDLHKEKLNRIFKPAEELKLPGKSFLNSFLRLASDSDMDISNEDPKQQERLVKNFRVKAFEKLEKLIAYNKAEIFIEIGNKNIEVLSFLNKLREMNQYEITSSYGKKTTLEFIRLCIKQPEVWSDGKVVLE